METIRYYNDTGKAIISSLLSPSWCVAWRGSPGLVFQYLAVVCSPPLPTLHAVIPHFQKGGQAWTRVGSHLNRNRTGRVLGSLSVPSPKLKVLTVGSYVSPWAHAMDSTRVSYEHMAPCSWHAPKSPQIHLCEITASSLNLKAGKLQLSARLNWPLPMGIALHSTARAAPGHFTKHLSQSTCLSVRC